MIKRDISKLAEWVRTTMKADIVAHPAVNDALLDLEDELSEASTGYEARRAFGFFEGALVEFRRGRPIRDQMRIEEFICDLDRRVDAIGDEK